VIPNGTAKKTTSHSAPGTRKRRQKAPVTP
jgi:hypothetical protein